MNHREQPVPSTLRGPQPALHCDLAASTQVWLLPLCRTQAFPLTEPMNLGVHLSSFSEDPPSGHSTHCIYIQYAEKKLL